MFLDIGEDYGLVENLKTYDKCRHVRFQILVVRPVGGIVSRPMIFWAWNTRLDRKTTICLLLPHWEAFLESFRAYEMDLVHIQERSSEHACPTVFLR